MQDYAATVGPTRDYAARSDGAQGGDPVKAARAIADAVAAGVPTLRLPLGGDAIDAIRKKLAHVASDVDQSESVARGTAY